MASHRAPMMAVNLDDDTLVRCFHKALKDDPPVDLMRARLNGVPHPKGGNLMPPSIVLTKGHFRCGCCKSEFREERERVVMNRVEYLDTGGYGTHGVVRFCSVDCLLAWSEG